MQTFGLDQEGRPGATGAAVKQQVSSDMPEQNPIPAALTVAGSDSGAGAGVQADLRAFAFFQVFGTCAITAATAQNPRQVRAVHPVPPSHVRAQMEAVLEAFDIRAAKTGMLVNSEIVDTVVEVLGARPDIPLVVDPVMIATSGVPLLESSGRRALCERLLPRAAVMTPNLPEAEAIGNRRVGGRKEVADAARDLARRFQCLAVIKGGHDPDNPSADTVSDGDRVWVLTSPQLVPKASHGTGCSLSAAIAAGLAVGLEPLEAVRCAKAYVFGCLQNCRQVGPDLWTMVPPAHLPLDQIRCATV